LIATSVGRLRLGEVLGLDAVEVRADRDHHVGGVPQPSGGLDVRRHPQQARVPRRHHARAAVGVQHRGAEPLGQPRHPGARAACAAAHPQQRALGAGQRRRRRVQRRAAAQPGRLRRDELGGRRRGTQQVGGDLEVDRPHRRLERGGDRRCGRGRDVRGRAGHVRRLHHRREHRRLVGRLVQDAAVGAGAPQRGRDVGRDDEHRRARRPRLADRRQRVGRARPRGGQRDAEPPAGARVAVGRVRRRLLVAYADEPDRRCAQRLPQRQVVDARQAEADLDAARLE
jgi:hypothetical protein